MVTRYKSLLLVISSIFFINLSQQAHIKYLRQKSMPIYKYHLYENRDISKHYLYNITTPSNSEVIQNISKKI